MPPYPTPASGSNPVKDDSAEEPTPHLAGSRSLSHDLHLRPNYRPDIDGIRALAIIPVVIFHAFPSLMPGGFVGVDIFFVISGFLISGIIVQALQRGSFSFLGFYANRIRRLFPALLVLLAACFLFGWFFLLPNEYERLGKHIVGAACYIENFVLRREAGYFDVRSYLKPLMHLWSLGVEEQFYLTYPLFLWLVWRFRRNLFAILVSMAIASFWLNVWQVRRDIVSDFFDPQTRWWELMVGAAIACWQLRPEESHPLSLRNLASPFAKPKTVALAHNIFSAVGLLLVAVAVFRIHENSAFPGWWALLPVSGAALLIIGGPSAWINRHILANTSMVFVGLISYPLYLWHWPILTLPRIIRGTELSASARSAGILLSFVLSWATWRFVEKPIRFGRKTPLKPIALTAVSIVLACLGYAAYRNGFIRRFPDFADDVGDPRGVQWSTPECRNIVGLAKIDYCRTTGPAPDVLLIGDSHGGSIYEGLAPAYREHSRTVMNLGEVGCVPFYNTDSFSPGVAHESCKPSLNRVFDFAASTASVRTIILSFRGARYMLGQGFGPAEEGAVKEILWDGATRNMSQPEMFTAAFRDSISRLYRTGKTVIVFLDWPELGFDPRSCLPRPVKLFSSPRPFCAVSRAEVDSRNLPYRDLVVQLQKEFPGLKAFDPLPYLCDASACHAMMNGHLLYSDDNHVSEIGAAYLAKKFIEESY